MSSEKHHGPPRWADRFLMWYCHPDFIDEIQGDLHEAYHARLKTGNRFVAGLIFSKDVILSISLATVRLPKFSLTNAIIMLQNNLLIFYRKFTTRKSFTVINVTGLSVSLAGALLIYLYVIHQLNFDTFNKNYDRIYRVYCDYRRPGEAGRQFPYTPPLLASAAKNEIAEITSICRVTSSGEQMVRVNDQSFTESNILTVDSTFLDIFSAAFIEGSSGLLAHPHRAILNKSTAIRYFGSPAAAVNKELIVGGQDKYTIAGVVEDFPSNSHLLFDALLSIDYANEQSHPDNWLAHNPITYILLNEDNRPAVVEDKMRIMTERILEPIFAGRFGKPYSQAKKEGGLQEYKLQALSKVHLYSAHMGEEGNIFYIYVFVGIGIALMTIAGFNYVNLSTARSTWEARSTGVRKILGATKGQMRRMFLTESTITVFIAFFAAVILAQCLLVIDNAFIRQFIPMENIPFNAVMVFAGISIILGMASGLIPARLLSAFEPIDVLKGQLVRGAKGNRLREIFVVMQFVVSMGLIMSTLVLNRQLKFMSNRSLGFDKEHLVMIKHIDQLGDKASALKDIVGGMKDVSDVSLCYGEVGYPSNNAAFTPVELIEQHREDVVIGIPVFVGDENYTKTLGARLLMGHSFPKDLPKERQQIILNKEAIRQTGWADRKESELIGKMIDVNGNRYELAGIVDDYNFRSMKYKILPMAILSHYWNSYNMLMVRIKPGTTHESIAALETAWRKVKNDIPFEYSFVDEDLNKLYAEEQNLGVMFTTFASIAIFIGCLGLFGLAMFLAERSIKEISIRKVLGASVTGIVFRLSRNMIKLIVVSFLVAAPVAWYLMDQWLSSFAYRDTTSAAPFIIAGAATLGVAFATISFQTIRAALTNPAETLRHE